MVSEIDARYFNALIKVRPIIGREDPRFERVPDRLERLLDRRDSDTLFGVFAEFLERLVRTSMLKHIQAVQGGTIHRSDSSWVGRISSTRPRQRGPPPDVSQLVVSGNADTLRRVAGRTGAP